MVLPFLWVSKALVDDLSEWGEDMDYKDGSITS